jgi:hypothetical protein
MTDYIRQQGVINFWQGEAHKNAHERAEAARKAHEANMGKIEAEKKVEEISQDIKGYEQESDYLLELGGKLLNKLNDTEAKLAKAEAEANFYKNLLSKPMAEIAQYNGDFKAVYETQQELLANWMVSQRAFKEVAIDLGIKTGMNKQEVVDLALREVKENVLNDETKHGNNASDMDFVKPYIEILKSKLKK